MVTITQFDTYQGEDMPLIALSNAKGMTVEFIPYGASIRAITLNDRKGTPTDVTLGFDNMAGYTCTQTYTGGTMGRFANRIGGASFTLNGVTYPLTANEGNNQLHGGFYGFDKRVWDFATTDNQVIFTLLSPHMEEGYPANLTATVTYTLTEDNLLDMSCTATADDDTIVSMTGHSYFNLSGHNSGTIEAHAFSLDAQSYTPCNSENIPTGEVCPVAGTPMDLRTSAPLRDVIHHPDLAQTRGFDHNFMLGETNAQPIAHLYSPKTGIALEVSTSLPAVQVYTAGFYDAQSGKDGSIYGMHQGIAIEPQFPPNAINMPQFASPLLKKGETYQHFIRYQFSLND